MFITGSTNPKPAMENSKSTWVSNIQLRRRPRTGKEYLSIKGDQINFQTYGIPINENKPISVRLTPSDRNQPGTSWYKINKGSPELKPVNIQISMRRLNIACLKVGDCIAQSLMNARR